MTTFAKARNLTTAGWLGYLIGLVVVVVTDHGEIGYGAVGTLIAVVMLAWTRRGSGRAPFIVSLVLSALLIVQSVAYVAADVGANPVDARVLVLDVVSLAAGLAVVAGSAWALRSRRDRSAVTV